MTTEVARPKLTYEDLLYWPEDGKRHELIDGEHYRLAGETYRREAELTVETGDRLSSPLFPGLEIPLAEIFK